MSEYSFIKGHGTENDFVLVPDANGQHELSAEQVARLCDRRAGIGGDGVIRVVRTDATEDPAAVEARGEAMWFMDYRNSDGSLSEMCGNGIRVLGHFLATHADVDPRNPLPIATRGGVKTLTFDGTLVTVDMGKPEVLGDTKVTVGDRSFDARHISMGNPHAVAFVDDLADAGPLHEAPGHDAARLPRRGQRRVRHPARRAPRGHAGARARVRRDPVLRHRRSGCDGGGCPGRRGRARYAVHRGPAGRHPRDRLDRGRPDPDDRAGRADRRRGHEPLTALGPRISRMDINGASAIVTGGASGIGAAVARQLAAKGAKVVVADLNAEKGQATADEIGGVFAPVDVTKTEQIEAAIAQAEELGPVRVLVNSAGIGWAQRTVGRDGEFSSAADLEAFSKVIAINLIGTFDCIRLVGTAISRNEPTESGERGAIVNMSSAAAFDGQIGQAAYSASKGGIVGMTLPVARDLAAVGIRVNTVAPGPDRHPDLRRGRGRRRVQGQARRERAVPQAARHPRRAGQHGHRVHHQLLHERRDRPGRRRHPDAAQVAGCPQSP